MAQKTTERGRKSKKDEELENLTKLVNPLYYWYGSFFGYAHTARACKVCQSDKRDILEMCLRNPEVSLSEIIAFDDSSPEPLFLNKANLSTHRSRHMSQDDLVLVQTAPDGKEPALLVPRHFLRQVPQFIENGKIIISKCSLGFCSCEWLETEGKKYSCGYQGRCPLKEYTRKQKAR